MNQARRTQWMIFVFALAVGVLADQYTKLLVVEGIKLYDRIPVLDGFFDLVHYRNTGIAFGLLRGLDSSVTIPLFALAALLALGFLVHYLHNDRSERWWVALALGLIGSGAIGNITDRIRLGSVVDFLLVYVGRHHWPAFNVADAAICVGAGLLILDSLRPPKSTATQS